MDQQPKKRLRDGVMALFRFAALLCRGLAFSGEVFLRQSFGPKFIGAQAIAAPAILLAYALFWYGCNLVPLLVFLAAYLVMCAAALIGVRRAKRSCDQLPDHYSGFPRMMKTFRSTISGHWIKRVLEPIYVALMGWLTRLFDEPLGVYLMIVAGALFLSVNAEWIAAYFRRRERAHDPSKPRPIRVQVRRISREYAERLYASSPNHAHGGRV